MTSRLYAVTQGPVYWFNVYAEISDQAFLLWSVTHNNGKWHCQYVKTGEYVVINSQLYKTLVGLCFPLLPREEPNYQI